MTRYEELKEKAEACRRAARRCSKKNTMFKTWLKHAEALEAEAANLPLIKAEAAQCR